MFSIWKRSAKWGFEHPADKFSLLAQILKLILEFVMVSLNFVYPVINSVLKSVVFRTDLCETKRQTVATLENRVSLAYQHDFMFSFQLP